MGHSQSDAAWLGQRLVAITTSKSINYVPQPLELLGGLVLASDARVPRIP